MGRLQACPETGQPLAHARGSVSSSEPRSLGSGLLSHLRLAAVALFVMPAAAAAAEGGEAIVLVADSRRFSGWEAWWTNLYNESHLYFALMTIVIIPALGLVMGMLTDFCMSRIGINLKSRVLAEH